MPGHHGSGNFCLPPCHRILGAEEVVTGWRSRTKVWGDGSPPADYTADALETGRYLDGYRRPGDDGSFLLWED
ncbi:hypothetical protein [Streptomyces sp. DG1A-41]|uniref:hypothetical protein n=1 Tax=Streptomyces sp. DG1A-41 TaxID=3125779 RepID=UPI0030CD3CF9